MSVKKRNGRKTEKNFELGAFGGTSLGFQNSVLRPGILFFGCNYENSFV